MSDEIPGFESGFPQSTDRIKVAVYSTRTGAIRQTVECTLVDQHRQHQAFTDHDYLDVTGQAVDANAHMVDLKTLAIVPRVYPLDEARARASLKIDRDYHAAVEQAWAAAAHSDAADPMTEFRNARANLRSRRDAATAAITAATDPTKALAITF